MFNKTEILIIGVVLFISTFWALCFLFQPLSKKEQYYDRYRLYKFDYTPLILVDSKTGKTWALWKDPDTNKHWFSPPVIPPHTSP